MRLRLPVAAALILAAAAVTRPGGAARAPAPAAAADTALFAGGCFWSMERPFQHVPGVLATVSGFAGGTAARPAGAPGAAPTETVQVVFDPAVVSYDQLLTVFWHNIDPLTRDAQFCDRGPGYRTAVFYRTAAQQAAAERSKAAIDRSQRFATPVVTEVAAATSFSPAPAFHQRFADRYPERYEAYRRGCGRSARLRVLWGDSAEPYVPRH